MTKKNKVSVFEEIDMGDDEEINFNEETKEQKDEKLQVKAQNEEMFNSVMQALDSQNP